MLTDIAPEIPDLLYRPCKGVVSHGAQYGVFGLLPTTNARENAKQMHSRSSRATRRTMRLCLHAQTAVHTGNICTGQTTIILITGKTADPQFESPSRDQNGANSRISGGGYRVYELRKSGTHADNPEFLICTL